VAKKQLPALLVVCDGETYPSHPDTPGGPDGVASLSVDSFTALRVLVGRRSEAQMRALRWSGADDPSPWFDALVVFSIPDADIADAR
jgi:hypothetical protein